MAKTKKEESVIGGVDVVVPEKGIVALADEAAEAAKDEAPPITFIQPKPSASAVVTEKLTLEEKLLKLLNKEHFVKANDIFKMELGPAAGQQETNKRLKGVLQKLADSGVIEIKNDAHKKLGRFFYMGENPQTQFNTVLNTPIEAKLA